jgi:type II secretory pathway pseudopilin PulG
MTVVAIIGVVSAIAISSMRGYSRHEETRKMASTYANVLSRARSEAVSSGRNTYVVFSEPTNGLVPFDDGEIAAIFSLNDDGTVAAIRPIFGTGTSNPDVTRYGLHGETVMQNIPLAPADESQSIPNGTMSSTVGGITIPVDPGYGVPVIAFSSRGSPVTMTNPDFGSGAGAVYVTDNDEMLLAVVVQPMGEVRTMAFDPSSQSWKQ